MTVLYLQWERFVVKRMVGNTPVISGLSIDILNFAAEVMNFR
jgi:hypothetical protein